MNEKLFIPLNATKSAGTNTTSPTERPNKSIELGKWIKRFFGISSNGDPNLVLNQQGDWVETAYDWVIANGTNLLDHLINISNPHSVTASQVGAYTSSEVDTLLGSKASTSSVATVLFKSITQTIVTGKTVETSIYAIPLPTDGLNYMLKVYSQAQVSTFAGLGITQRLRVGSYASPIDGLTGANSIGLQTNIATNGVGGANQCPLSRNFIFKGGASGSIYGISIGGNIPDDGNSLANFSTLATKDFTTQHYLYVTFNPSNIGAVVTHDQIYITLIKI